MTVLYQKILILFILFQSVTVQSKPLVKEACSEKDISLAFKDIVEKNGDIIQKQIDLTMLKYLYRVTSKNKKTIEERALKLFREIDKSKLQAIANLYYADNKDKVYLTAKDMLISKNGKTRINYYKAHKRFNNGDVLSLTRAIQLIEKSNGENQQAHIRFDNNDISILWFMKKLSFLAQKQEGKKYGVLGNLTNLSNRVALLTVVGEPKIETDKLQAEIERRSKELYEKINGLLEERLSQCSDFYIDNKCYKSIKEISPLVFDQYLKNLVKNLARGTSKSYVSGHTLHTQITGADEVDIALSQTYTDFILKRNSSAKVILNRIKAFDVKVDIDSGLDEAFVNSGLLKLEKALKKADKKKLACNKKEIMLGSHNGSPNNGHSFYFIDHKQTVALMVAHINKTYNCDKMKQTLKDRKPILNRIKALDVKVDIASGLDETFVNSGLLKLEKALKKADKKKLACNKKEITLGRYNGSPNNGHSFYFIDHKQTVAQMAGHINTAICQSGHVVRRSNILNRIKALDVKVDIASGLDETFVNSGLLKLEKALKKADKKKLACNKKEIMLGSHNGSPNNGHSFYFIDHKQTVAQMAGHINKTYNCDKMKQILRDRKPILNRIKALDVKVDIDSGLDEAFVNSGLLKLEKALQELKKNEVGCNKKEINLGSHNGSPNNGHSFYFIDHKQTVAQMAGHIETVFCDSTVN